jgi:signal transduction histidine kinase/ActR/RegA family two-component response regulator
MRTELIKKRLLTAMCGALAALAALTVVLLWQLRTESINAAWLQRRLAALNQAQSARNMVASTQDALAIYLLSANPADLITLKQTVNDAEDSLNVLKSDWSGVIGKNRASAIFSTHRRLTATMLPVLDGNTPLGQGRAIIEQTAPVSRSLLASFDQLIDDQNRLIRSRDGQPQGLENRLFYLVPISVGALCLMLIAVVWRETKALAHEHERILRDSDEVNLRTNNFLATVSHELRNPLNLILLWSRLLLSGENDRDKIRRGLSSIDRAAQSQAQLIEDLLDFSKIESGRLRLDMQPTDLPAVVKAGVDAMAAPAEAKSIELRSTIDPRAGTILSDPQRLQQALWNLLSNAVKFTPGGGSIQVQLARINSHIELAVRDTGQGIAPSLLPHVFDRFWQADTAAQDQKKGMGLGLTIVNHIVTMHGGSIRVHSEGVGKGATFTIRLPLPTAAEGFRLRRRPPTLMGTPDLVRIPRLTGLQIMVVDDDQEATEALRGVLKSLGADPLVADSADSALELLSEHRPDVMVSDIAMPGRDGLSLAREVRDREQRAHSGHLPLVALTAYGRVEDKVEIFSAGFDSHVIKPVEPAELAAVIRSVLEPERGKL